MKKIQDLSTDIENRIAKADNDYKFQALLTNKLDVHVGEFAELTLLEIVLWKTNRYPTISKDILTSINELRKEYKEEKAKDLLKMLLRKDIKGFDLPMVSTVLRFACPNELQIIDQRVYRYITPDKDFLKIPHNIDSKINLYFKYIGDLKKVCELYNIPFHKADRIIYQLDKIENKEIPIISYTPKNRVKNLD